MRGCHCPNVIPDINIIVSLKALLLAETFSVLQPGWFPPNLSVCLFVLTSFALATRRCRD